ncbi:hypothetical protein DFS34DRAFT_436360 [Phlyctochytrium arcticum]|nr:hypothetical protein DFS34DRAFT_436360 [Phlyctochytrium arcticum]
MVATPRIAPRAPVTTPCSCIWQALQEQREREAREHAQQREAHETSKFGQVTAALNPLNAIPGAFFKRKDEEDVHLNPEEIPSTAPDHDSTSDLHDSHTSSHNTAATRRPRNEDKVVDRNPIYADPRFGTTVPNSKDAHAAVAARIEKKGLILGKKGWLGKARPFKLLGKTNEQKIGELISYREDLVNLLHTLIPSTRLHDAHTTHPPVILPIPHTPLCASCQCQLAYAMYYSPGAHSTFIRESATASFLALLDDCTASMEAGLPLEYITHHQLDSILRHELAVIEWRVAVFLAKFHKKTGFLKEFPIRLGEYGEFEVNVKPPGAPEGIVKKTGKKILSAVGLGASEGPSGQVQGAEDQ